ncbi:hypothetical protein ACFVIM_17310 [Streptomyces sp. NPDC057638]|uniref:hypothetical protein n=1 Tax=Streptomyces sp. NPDC057638 TaxID=3346190 RepID=UPI003674E2BF
MSTYCVQYADGARDALMKMARSQRDLFEAQIARVAMDPYRYGIPLAGNRDRREDMIAGAVTVFWLSAGVLTVSVVRTLQTG